MICIWKSSQISKKVLSQGGWPARVAQALYRILGSLGSRIRWSSGSSWTETKLFSFKLLVSTFVGTNGFLLAKENDIKRANEMLLQKLLAIQNGKLKVTVIYLYSVRFKVTTTTRAACLKSHQGLYSQLNLLIQTRGKGPIIRSIKTMLRLWNNLSK